MAEFVPPPKYFEEFIHDGSIISSHSCYWSHLTLLDVDTDPPALPGPKFSMFGTDYDVSANCIVNRSLSITTTKLDEEYLKPLEVYGIEQLYSSDADAGLLVSNSQSDCLLAFRLCARAEKAQRTATGHISSTARSSHTQPRAG